MKSEIRQYANPDWDCRTKGCEEYEVLYICSENTINACKSMYPNLQCHLNFR